MAVFGGGLWNFNKDLIHNNQPFIIHARSDFLRTTSCLLKTPLFAAIREDGDSWEIAEEAQLEMSQGVKSGGELCSTPPHESPSS